MSIAVHESRTTLVVTQSAIAEPSASSSLTYWAILGFSRVTELVVKDL